MPSAFFPKHDRTESNNGIPIFEANPITRVFREVPLTKGGGSVPVQFQYSNAVHGPQGPIEEGALELEKKRRTRWQDSTAL